MTQETPPVEPASTPKPKASNGLITTWNSLSNGVKIAIAVVAVIVVFAIAGSGGSSNTTPVTSPTTVDTTPTTISLADQWNAWKLELTPVISQTQTDYTQTQADLSNADYEASTQDFATLSQDATDLASLATSPDVTVNNDIIELSVALHAVASSGISAMDSGDLTQFSAALDRYRNAENKLATDLATGNSTYI